MYWYEIYDEPLENQLNEVRERRRLTFGTKGHLLEVPVEKAQSAFQADLDTETYECLQFVMDPLPEEIGLRYDGTCGLKPKDDAHCLLNGIDHVGEELHAAIAQSLVNVVTRVHAALKRDC